MNTQPQKTQTINEDIDAKKARNLMYAIKSVINGKREVGFVDVNKRVINLLEKNHIGVIPVRMSGLSTMMCIIYTNKEKALRLYEIAKSKGGYLNDRTAHEAREIGQLLGYTTESINEYIWNKYISKLSTDVNTHQYDDLDESISDSFFTKDPFQDFEAKFRKEQNKNDIIFSAQKYDSDYTSTENVVILRNPKSLENIAPQARGIIDFRGNLYIDQNAQLIHIDIIEILGKLDLIKFDDDYYPWLLPEYYITVIRLGRTNSFYLGGESGGMIPHEDRYNLYPLDIIDEMPEVEQAAPVYQKFLNLAKQKNPGINFVNQIFGRVPKTNIQEQSFSTFKKQITKDIKKGGLEKRLLYTFKNEVKIYAVNADFVRDKKPGMNFNGFTDGGSHYVTSLPGYKKWIPEDEIWIDDVFLSKPNDLAAIILHELLERHLMKYYKVPYDTAHSDFAEKAESEYRESVKSGIDLDAMKKIFRKYIRNYKENHKKKLNENFQFKKTINLINKISVFLLYFF